MKNTMLTSLALGSLLTLGAAGVNAAENPFAAKSLKQGYQLAENMAEEGKKCKDKEGKCGEGKCDEKGKKCKDKEGKCGEGKCGDEKSEGKSGDKKAEGSCGGHG